MIFFFIFNTLNEKHLYQISHYLFFTMQKFAKFHIHEYSSQKNVIVFTKTHTQTRNDRTQNLDIFNT